jgi:nitrate/nitrite transporter NarK
MMAIFMSAIPLSGVIAGPISGWILGRMTGVGHLAAWQWMLLLEGIPSFLAGIVILVSLTDHPGAAHWLDDAERGLIIARLKEEEEAKRRSGSHGGHSFADAFRNPAVWLLSIVFFALACTNYGIGFWLPQLIKESITKDPVWIGWISAIPWAVTTVVMLLVGRHSDLTGERRWHFAISSFVIAAGFILSVIPGLGGVLHLLGITMAAAGTLSSIALFWAFPTALLSGTAAAAGIAWINSVGNLGGFASPYVIGMVRDATHSTAPALLMLAGVSLLGAFIQLFVTRKRSAN